MRLFVYIFVILSLSWPASYRMQEAFARAVYPFQNEEGFFVIPGNPAVYTPKNPGPWRGLIKEHAPILDIRTRNEGLQHLFLIEISVPHPMPAVPTDEELRAHPTKEPFDEPRLQEVYLVDKDDVILGYYQFLDTEIEAKIKTTINGVINYFKIYVVCSHHGIWKSEHTLPQP